ncbi:nuclear transport factor 2 family protein [Scrofimicrobium canadense]|uniref:nuclear transport factor 2 family protein n=1 Tax=Scrofimicrobium canadense TaxID=2652290 RepID=UPI0019812E58|nr:nuclear transport factor 2 family protein [Scrofimicrobium canadense]
MHSQQRLNIIPGRYKRENDSVETADEALEKYLAATNSYDFNCVADVLIPDAIYSFGDATCAGIDQVRTYFERTWAASPDEVYWAENVEWIVYEEKSAVAVYTYIGGVL